eukprot:gene7975-13874_t
MAARLDLPPLPPFDAYTDPSSVGQRWKSWRRRFQTYLAAIDVTSPVQQRALLLYQVGQDTQDIFDTIPNNGEDDDYETALEKLDEYFLPKKNIDFEIFQFRKATQNRGETIDQFATRLRKLAANCEFRNVDTEIKSMIIQHCLSTRLRRYALREDTLTLDALLTKARALEVSEAQAIDMEQNLLLVEPLHSRDTANFVTRNRAVQQKPHRPQAQNRRPTGKCRNCGYTWPHTKSPCPAQGKQCNTCGKNNHFSKVCRAKQFPPKQRPSQGKNIRQISQASAPPQSESDDEYLFTLTTKKNKSPAVEVKINNCPVQMILDTGASTNIVDQATYNTLAAKGKIRLQKSDASLFAYNMDTPLKTLGKFTATFESKHKVTVDDIHVISGNAGCLLSYKTASDLMLITLHINTVDNCPLNTGELFQRVISDQIRDIPGAINISDDVIIYGKTPEEHNNALKAVIEKFIKVGLTLNREKCLFAQKSLTFFGFVFSDKGVSADPEKFTTENTSETHQHLVHRDFIEKGKMKENTDRAQRAKASGIDIGDTVLVKQPKQNKLSTNFNPDPYIVIEKKGTMLTAYNEGKDHTITRNISHFKRFPIQKETEIDSDIDDEDIMDMPNRPNVQAEVLIPRYPVRERRNARRYGQNIYET